MSILLRAIYPYLFLLLYLLIPFDNYIRALPNVLMVVLVAAFPFVVRRKDFEKIKTIPGIIFFLLFIFLCLNSLFADRWWNDFNIIKKVMIALGLAILYIPISDIRKIKGAIIFSSLAAILFSVYNFVLITDATGSFALGESPQVVESVLIDRLYLGLLSLFSILISLQAIKKQFHPNNSYHLANILINLSFIVLIASKIALVSLFVIILIRQFYGSRKIWKITIGIVAFLAVVGLFFLMKDASKHTREPELKSGISISFLENSMTYELRSVVWSCAKNVIDQSGFLMRGMGFEQTNTALISCYGQTIKDDGKRQKFITAEYNTHNQFLDFYLSAGFVALVLFLAFISISFIAVHRNFFPTAMLALLVIYASVENLFHRQIGAYYVGFILIVMFSNANLLRGRSLKEK